MMESIDPKSLLYLVAIGEASDDEMLRLSELMEQDPHLAVELREELEFSEWMRHAVKDRSNSQQTALEESIAHRELDLEEWINLARDGDMSVSAADELARRLLDAPDQVALLRRGLIEDERIAQIISSAKSEDAFVDSLVTRMWAESREDHFVKDFSKKLEAIDREERSNIVAFPGTSWKSKVGAVAALAAAVAIGAFVVTSQLEQTPVTGAVAKINKSTYDAVWAEGSKPGPDGILKSGKYRLEAGAVSLAMPGGEALAVQGPAVFEVDRNGEAVLYEGVALATSSMPKPPGNHQIGIGLSAKNVSFSKGAITVGLDARSPESTEAVVFSGETGVCITGAKMCRNVFEFESVKADHTQEKFVDVPYNPRAFSKAWELVSGVERNLGDIVIELPGVSSSSRKSESNEIRVFVERDRFKPDHPMEVDVIKPGHFATSDNVVEGRSLASNGEEMRSYLLQLWPGDSKRNGEEVEASVTFDHPVVGVIFSSERLWESDRAVGASTQHLVDASHRGLDSKSDQILLSEDGRTLNLKLRGNEAEVDQVRVFVALK